jgi:hypothetical protein
MTSRVLQGFVATAVCLALAAAATAQLPPPGQSSGAKTSAAPPAATNDQAPPPATTTKEVPPLPGPALEGPASTPPPANAAPSAPAIPGLGQFLGPDGIALPGGAGFIRPGSDQIGIDIMTPDGPLHFNVPRRRGRRAIPAEQPAPGSDTDAPAFGAAPTSPTTSPATPGDQSNTIPLRPVEPKPLESVGHEAPARSGPLAVRPNAAGAPTGAAARELSIGERVFRTRNYASVIRGLSRALDRAPGDRGLLQLRSLAFFAVGDYPAASRDAYVVLAENDVWDWVKLRSLYRSVDEYTAQFRALEQQAAANPNAAELRLLLGYHYMMMGHLDAARRQFEAVVTLDPANETARRLARPAGASGNEGPPLPALPADPNPAAAPRVIPGTPPTGPMITIPRRSAPTASSASPKASATPPATGPVAVDLGAPSASSSGAPKSEGK